MAETFAFREFHLHIAERRLTRGDQLVHLEPKAFDLLSYLVAHAGRLVAKQELVDAIWAPAVVTDNSLTRCVHQVRSALDDDAAAPHFIETVPGAGYRFVAPVTATTDPPLGAHGRAAPTSWIRKPMVLVLVCLVVVAGILAGGQFRKSADARLQRLAVLPLTNLTGDPDQQYFVDGVHEALIAEVSRIQGIDVISRTSANVYRDTDLGIPEIAERLGVDVVMEGSVARSGDDLTVTAQLIATDPERHLWAERYHRNVGDVFEITTNVARAIATEMAVSLGAAEESLLSQRRPVDPEAYDAYLLGRYSLERRNKAGFQNARQYFQAAVAVDPEFAPAYVGLAQVLGSAATFGMRKPGDSYPRARELGEQAVRLDSTLASAHRTLAAVHFYWDWDWQAAERAARRALALDPNAAGTYRFLAEVLSVTGRHSEAVAAVHRGRELDPLAPLSRFKPTLIHYLAGNYDSAVKSVVAALEAQPGFWQGHWLLCLSRSAIAQAEAAITACEVAVETSRRTPWALSTLGYEYALAGRVEAAEALIVELHTLSQTRYVSPACLAIVYGALGRRDEAFRWLQQAYADRSQWLIHADSYRFFDPLRADPQFAAMRQQTITES